MLKGLTGQMTQVVFSSSGRQNDSDASGGIVTAIDKSRRIYSHFGV